MIDAVSQKRHYSKMFLMKQLINKNGTNYMQHAF